MWMMNANFNNARVLALESRRAQEISKLISNAGGVPIVVPSVEERALESNTEALDFARKLQKHAFDIVIFMTGVGVSLLTRIVERVYSISEFAALLGKTVVVARGPKPVAALRQLGVPIHIHVPEPNTWHDLLAELDQRGNEFPLRGKRIALQEYGVSNPELISGLEQRGAVVTPVPVYEWTLPHDTGPLRKAVDSVIADEIDIVLLTSSVQIRHLFQVAESVGKAEALHSAMKQVVVASIGPLCSEEIRNRGLSVDMEPSHPRMGILVQEAAEKSGALLQQKRGR